MFSSWSFRNQSAGEEKGTLIFIISLLALCCLHAPQGVITDFQFAFGLRGSSSMAPDDTLLFWTNHRRARAPFQPCNPIRPVPLHVAKDRRVAKQENAKKPALVQVQFIQRLLGGPAALDDP